MMLTLTTEEEVTSDRDSGVIVTSEVPDCSLGTSRFGGLPASADL